MRSLEHHRTIPNICVVLCCVVLISCAPVALTNLVICNPGNSPYGGGSGTSFDPYLICDVTQLQNVNQNLSANYLLTTNIDLANSNLTPIGSYSKMLPFTGVFDGGNYSLSNWTFTNTSTTDSVGLFSFASGTIQNLNLVNFKITTGSFSGILAGAGGSTAGITVKNCSTAGILVAGADAGGILGLANGAVTISHSFSTATINSTGTYNGGLIGWSGSDVTVSSSYFEGNLTCMGLCKSAGGIAGALRKGHDIISNSFFTTGAVISSGIAGGLLGTSYGLANLTINNSYATGTVSGGTVGGIIGELGNFLGAPTVSLVNVYTAGPISGSGPHGGLLGLNQGTATSVSSYCAHFGHLGHCRRSHLGQLSSR
jgi:hypothetical protein